MLLISHDRAFLNVLVDRVVEVDAGCLAEYPGNYDDYLRRKSPPSAPQEPEQATVSAAQQATVSAAKQATLPAAPPATAGNVAAPLSKRERIAARELAKENSRRHQRNLKLLTKIEDEIREQEERLEALGWQLGDPDLHRDADGVRRLEAERSELRSAVDALYQQWERLAAEVEAGEQVQG
jgi:ATPase subunit of ABC transporter with duplicated ATPase domains